MKMMHIRTPLRDEGAARAIPEAAGRFADAHQPHRQHRGRGDRRRAGLLQRPDAPTRSSRRDVRRADDRAGGGRARGHSLLHPRGAPSRRPPFVHLRPGRHVHDGAPDGGDEQRELGRHRLDVHQHRLLRGLPRSPPLLPVRRRPHLRLLHRHLPAQRVRAGQQFPPGADQCRGRHFMSLVFKSGWSGSARGSSSSGSASRRQTSEIAGLNEKLKDENLRMSHELAVAAHIQSVVLPRESDYQAFRDLEISCQMLPAAEVGGDFYDTIHFGPEGFISIGDVTDHGLHSGLIMMMVHTALRALAKVERNDIQRIYNVINKLLYDFRLEDARQPHHVAAHPQVPGRRRLRHDRPARVAPHPQGERLRGEHRFDGVRHVRRPGRQRHPVPQALHVPPRGRRRADPVHGRDHGGSGRGREAVHGAGHPRCRPRGPVRLGGGHPVGHHGRLPETRRERPPLR